MMFHCHNLTDDERRLMCSSFFKVGGITIHNKNDKKSMSWSKFDMELVCLNLWSVD